MIISPNERRGSVTAQAQADRRTQAVNNLIRERTFSGRLSQIEGDGSVGGNKGSTGSKEVQARLNPGTNDRYSGEVDTNGLMHGKGKLIFENGDIYEGQFVQGKMHGEGKLYTHGSTHEGLFQNDVKSGAGSEVFANGDRSVGVWVNGELEGNGTFFLTNGEMFDCVWLHGMMKSRVRTRAQLSVNSSDKMTTRDHVVRELLSTERTYVRELNVVMNTYFQGLSSNSTIIKEEGDMSVLFANLPSILSLNTQFLQAIESRLETWQPEKDTIGDLFVSVSEDLKEYTKYVSNHSQATELLSKIMRTQEWSEFMKTSLMSQGMIRNLDSYLILPVQRIPRYVLLIKEMQKHTPQTHPDSALLSQAYECIEGVARSINEAIKATEQQAELTRLEARFDEHPYFSIHVNNGDNEEEKKRRILLKTGALNRVTGKEEKQERVVFVYFLFEDLLAWAVPLSLIGEYEFHLVGKFPRQFLEITPNPFDPLSLDMCYVCDGKLHTVQLSARTAEERTEWLAAFGSNTENLAAHTSSQDVKSEFYNIEVSERIEREKLILQDESFYEQKLVEAQKRAVKEQRGGVSLSTGGRYIGPAMKENIVCSGVMFFPKQARYEGQFLNYSMHGNGIFFTANGSRYEGQFKHGLFWGKGTWFASNGSCEGRFRAGVQHGPATTFHADNSIDDSLWVAGQCACFTTRPVQLPLDLKPLTENLRTVFTYPTTSKQPSSKTTTCIATCAIKPSSIVVDYKTSGFFAKNHQRELIWAKQMAVAVSSLNEVVIRLPLSSDSSIEKTTTKEKNTDFVEHGASESAPLVLAINPVPSFLLCEILLRYLETDGFPDPELLQAEILLSRCQSVVKTQFRGKHDTEQGISILFDLQAKLRSDLRRITSMEKIITDEVAEQRLLEANSKKLRDQTTAGVAQARGNERAQFLTPLQHTSTLLADMLKQVESELTVVLKPKVPARRATLVSRSGSDVTVESRARAVTLGRTVPTGTRSIGQSMTLPRPGRSSEYSEFLAPLQHPITHSPDSSTDTVSKTRTSSPTTSCNASVTATPSSASSTASSTSALRSATSSSSESSVSFPPGVSRRPSLSATPSSSSGRLSTSSPQTNITSKPSPPAARHPSAAAPLDLRLNIVASAAPLSHRSTSIHSAGVLSSEASTPTIARRPSISTLSSSNSVSSAPPSSNLSSVPTPPADNPSIGAPRRASNALNSVSIHTISDLDDKFMDG